MLLSVPDPLILESAALAARGRSLAGRVTAKRGRILGGDDVAMLIHCEESTTTKTAPFRRNPLGAGGFGPQALSFVGHDEKTSFRSSLRACNPKTPARGPRDFCHGLLETGTSSAVGSATGRVPYDAFSYRIVRARLHPAGLHRDGCRRVRVAGVFLPGTGLL